MDQVPEATREMFTDGDYEKADRLAELKRRLKRSGCEVYEGYPASWLRLECWLMRPLNGKGSMLPLYARPLTCSGKR